MSGLPGSGTSTAARKLAEAAGMRVLSAGEVFRDMAEERDMSLEDFSVLAEENEEIDRKLDKRIVEEASPGMIMEGRLTGHLLHMSDKGAFKVWIKAPLETRVRRIAEREGHEDLDQLKERVIKRENSEEKRYREYYDIDLFDTSFYDAVIDSEKNRPDQIVDKIIDGVTDEVRDR
ncbi:MAG: cytidylate kinase family protein [Candidatus Thermoplasmatota archaeon]